MQDTRRELAAPIRALVADDQSAARLGIRSILNGGGGIDVVAECDCAADALRHARDDNPDVIVSDMMSPGGDGLRLLQGLRAGGSTAGGGKQRPRTPVLVYTSIGNRLLSVLTLRLGARGFLMKTSPPDELRRAVRHVAAGEQYVMDEHRLEGGGAKARRPPRQITTPAGLELLSPAEVQVLHLIAQGYETPQIAEVMHRGKKTVETYRSRIRAKLELRNSTQLAQFAWRVLYDRRLLIAWLWFAHRIADVITDGWI